MADVHGPVRVRKAGRKPAAGSAVFDAVLYALLVLFCVTILYPFWSTLLLSFSSQKDASSLGFHFWISSWSLSAYRYVLGEENFLIAYRNSIFRTVTATALILAFTLLMAYPLSKKNLVGRNFFTIALLVTMFFSGGLIPTYLLIRQLGLIDSLWSLILPNLTVGYYVIITRNYLMTIDKSYEESAFMDGANYLYILTRIVVPLAKPVIATIALWTAVGHWNAWFDALVYLKSDSKMVLQVLLRKLVLQVEDTAMRAEMMNFRDLMSVEMPTAAVKAATILLTIGPIILVYPFLQKYFIKGIFLGSLKG